MSLNTTVVDPISNRRINYLILLLQALRKIPSFFNRSNLVVTDEYRENFLKAEATFKHQYVYDPIERKMLRLTEPEDEGNVVFICIY